jgi:hypothetical protein
MKLQIRSVIKNGEYNKNGQIKVRGSFFKKVAVFVVGGLA